MQSPIADSRTDKGSERVLGPALGDQKQGDFSIKLWKNAFHDALKRLCPVRAGGHECGCLPVLARKVSNHSAVILRLSFQSIYAFPVWDNWNIKHELICCYLLRIWLRYQLLFLTFFLWSAHAVAITNQIYIFK